MSHPTRTWLITGCSTGFGRALAEILIARGEIVYATARRPEQIADLVEGHANAHALKLDVTAAEDIAAVVAAAGAVDVLVNNAGYGYLTAFEEGEEAGYRAQFETNLFGLIALTQAVLPGMRARGSGHIVNIASVGGLIGNPGSSFYAATKFGVVGLSEALSQEVGPLGIKVTVVEPGPFRTDWGGRSLQSAGRRIEAYKATVHDRLDTIANYSGQQPGDPVRGAEVIIAAVDSEQPPLNLILGAFGVKAVRDKLARLSAEIDAWEQVSLDADYPVAAATAASHVFVGSAEMAEASHVPLQVFPPGVAPCAAPAGNFTGSPTVTSPFKAVGTAAGGAAVTFQPGAHTNWHSHPRGQLLVVTEGVGWVQAEGEPVRLIRPSDVVWIAPSVRHWHGATRATGMTHVAISESVDGTTVTWSAPVTDAEYRGPNDGSKP